MKTMLLLVSLSLVAVLRTTRAELRDEAIHELIKEIENEIQKFHLTSMNFETDYCDGPNVPHGILRQICKNLLQAYLGHHVTSIGGFKAVLYNFVSIK